MNRFWNTRIYHMCQGLIIGAGATLALLQLCKPIRIALLGA